MRIHVKFIKRLRNVDGRMRFHVKFVKRSRNVDGRKHDCKLVMVGIDSCSPSSAVNDSLRIRKGIMS